MYVYRNCTKVSMSRQESSWGENDSGHAVSEEAVGHAGIWTLKATF